MGPGRPGPGPATWNLKAGLIRASDAAAASDESLRAVRVTVTVDLKVGPVLMMIMMPVIPPGRLGRSEFQRFKLILVIMATVTWQ